MSEIQFEWKLIPRGKVDCDMQIGGDEIRFCGTSYGDPIGDLLSIAIEVGRGSQQELAVLHVDPGFFYFQLTRVSAQRLRVGLAWFDGYFSPRTTQETFEDGASRFAGECGLFDFIESMEASLRSFIARIGLPEYEKQWDCGGFPMERLDELKQVVDDLKRDRELE